MTVIDKNGKLKDLHATREDNLFTAVIELQRMKDREEREAKEQEERKKAFFASLQTEEFKREQEAEINAIFEQFKSAMEKAAKGELSWARNSVKILQRKSLIFESMANSLTLKNAWVGLLFPMATSWMGRRIA